jgi:ABC-type nitrate/sulfonate/bicarbonate transport system substrate-binding protein
VRRAAGALCVALTLSACGVKQEVVSAPQAQPFVVILDRPPNATHAALYSALGHGDFRTAGLEVTPVAPATPSEPLARLAAGEGDMAIASEPELLRARDRGLKLVSIAALLQRPLPSITGIPGQHIEREEGVPPYDALVLVVRQQQAEREGEDLRAFLQALTRGQQQLVADPRAIAALLARGHARGAQRAQLESIANTLPASYPASGGQPYGYQDPSAWEAFGGWMYAQGLLHTNPSTLSPPFTNEFLPGQGL